MQVLKIVAEGPTTSFRYPHFVQGVHPTFEMPPPATIYGHICSAVGEYITLDKTRFAYHFAFDAKFFDYEHLHFFGKNPKMNPFQREMLFNPRLTLYLDNIELKRHFVSPRYPVILGRAQDLMTYTYVGVVTLEQADRAFYDGTLLSLRDAAAVGGRSFAVTMPKFIDEYRRPTWSQYAILPASSRPPVYPGDDSLVMEGQMIDIWIDPDVTHPYIQGLHRGVLWHSWQDET